MERDGAITMEMPPQQQEESFSGTLLPAEACNEMRSRWETVQAGFVDEPKRAVQQADELVSDAIKRLSDSFAAQRSRLEQQWSQDGDVSTEDLRQALRRYRAFFQRLLAI